MDNALYISLARQSQLYRTVDVVANNVANAETPGYKRETMLFTDYLADAGRAPTGDSHNHDIAFSYDFATARDTSNGPLSDTGRPLDVAIRGEGYFGVDTPEGNTFYTRLGNFTISTQGQLVNAQGDAARGIGGAPIGFVVGDQDVQISQAGEISALGVDGIRVQRGQLEVYTFANELSLQRIDNTRFSAGANNPATPAPIANYMIAQGVLEGSNVNPTTELTRLITATRSAESAAKMVNELHNLQRDMISRVTAPAQ